jgi:3-deoxy-D-manno-octulosonic-acid transferase
MNLLFDLLYVVAGAFLLPVWLWKLPKARRYRAGIRERAGLAPRLSRDRPRLWVHCASVGEAGIPRELVALFGERHPDWEVVFSTNTDTGSERLQRLYPGAPVFYWPFDLTPCVAAALDRVAPTAVVLVELEVWPNFAAACLRRSVPIAVVNGRIGAGSRRLLRVLSRLQPRLWDAVAICCARSAEDALGFEEAGLPGDRIAHCGLLKCDQLEVDPDSAGAAALRDLFAIPGGSSVLVAGSTHQGEEAVLATAYKELKRRHRNLRMVVVPRHVERAGDAVQAVRGRGLKVRTKTGLADAAGAPEAPSAPDDDIIVVDTIGDLVSCYGLATCAFVGRSLLPPGGGQNVLEPAALGRPVVTGPHTRNFGPEMNLLLGAGAASVVRDTQGLIEEIDRLLCNPADAEAMGRAGRGVVMANRGATARTLTCIEAAFGRALGSRAGRLNAIDAPEDGC